MKQIATAIGALFGERCLVCGKRSFVRRRSILGPHLIATWELDPRLVAAFDEREGCSCRLCGNSLRSRQLAQVLVTLYSERLHLHARSLRELVEQAAFRDLDIAEINSCGGLHRYLSQLPRLRYSEYGSNPSGTRSEDLANLSYADNAFDLVLTSETLEHVPEFEIALAEILRVLRPGGMHIFTIPVIRERPHTRRRAVVREGVVQHLLPASYHGDPSLMSPDYLVFSEFGDDVVKRIRSVGFEVNEIRHPRNPVVSTFVTTKPR